LAITGTNVSDSKKDAIRAKPTESDKGKNIPLGTPDINKEGVKTARILRSMSKRGPATSLQASRIAFLLDFPRSRC
jgi:hypothetical protein